jgi:hypothetical protein
LFNTCASFLPHGGVLSGIARPQVN